MALQTLTHLLISLLLLCRPSTVLSMNLTIITSHEFIFTPSPKLIQMP
jgi:hypothetical protein